MNNLSRIVQILIVILLVIIAYYFISLSRMNDTIYEKSGLDNKEYLVLNLDDKDKASYMLSIINKRINILKKYLSENIDKYPEYKPYIEQFNDRTKNIVLQENPPNGKYTSYTVDKGKEIALCLRSKNTGELHDINLVMYVVLHELAHVACPEVDHTELFKKIFIFLIQIANMLDVYHQTDYQGIPHEYCGLTISENLLKK